jgi:hypothetical protein
MRERIVQNQLCKYLDIRYPDVPYRTDKDGQFAKGGALWDKARQKGKKGFPDLIIPHRVGQYPGLVIELKRDGESVFKKNGDLRKDDHLADQAWWLEWFKGMGCYSSFAIGFDEGKEIIDKYLSGKL